LREVGVTDECGQVTESISLASLQDSNEDSPIGGSWHSLAHLGESLASHSVTTLPIRLVFCEEDCTTSQSMFLENPSSFTQVTIQDMAIEIVDVFADIEGRFCPFLDGYVFPLASVLQKSVNLIVSAAGSYHTIRGTKHVFHLLGLGCEISAWALDDTNRVDPQVPLVECPCRDDGIPKGRG
jgi:hypothetical protein